MISPKAIDLIIRHFDAVDEAVSRRVTRKRPWGEPALTSLLYDLLDDETQKEEKLRYSLVALNNDLATIDGLLRFSFSVDTHEYSSAWERWVTQADLGFVIRFEDRMLPEQSWSTGWLLQAKRLYPRRRAPAVFDEGCRFSAVDSEQHQRMEQLIETVGVPFVKYMLYSARPEHLDDLTRHKLAHLQNTSLSGKIFDYTLGLQLHRELSSSTSSLAAGIFVADPLNPPRTLAEVHRTILQTNLPLSWFLASHLANNYPGDLDRGRPGGARRGRHPDPGPSGGGEEWAEGIVTGDDEAVGRLLEALETEDTPAFPILPRHTLTVNIVVGPAQNDEHGRIRFE